ncbi:hypothetical protein OQA88_13396 [Cercophora sp. LCS_1]
MGRTSPPAAIIAPPPLALETTESKPSDLPLRNFTVSTENKTPPTPTMPLTPPDDVSLTPLSTLETSRTLDNDDEPPTPSSTIVEFDEGEEQTVEADEPVGILAENIARSFGRSRSMSGQSNHLREASRSNTPKPTGRSSRSRTRADSPRHHARDNSTSESVSRYLRNQARGPPSDPTRELVQENTSLHQRIAGLQRSERDLLLENQELNRQLTSFRNLHESRRKKWREQHRDRERAYQARIQELEAGIAQQDMERKRQAVVASERAHLLTDADLISWFTIRSTAWQSWADDYAHLDPKRVQSGLHPIQMLELCEGVNSSATPCGFLQGLRCGSS